MRVLGIDPGSRVTGLGCIEYSRNNLHLVGARIIQVESTSRAASVPMADRYLKLAQGLSAALEEWRPEVISLEKVFFAKNAISAIKLGQARGALMVPCAERGLPIFEYGVTEAKRTLTNDGHASKEQVAKILQHLFGKFDFERFDATDALALAYCHAMKLRSLTAASGATLSPPRLSAPKNSLQSVAQAFLDKKLGKNHK